MSKYSIFGVNIQPEIISQKNNILRVSSKKEIFYDIFECSFNGKKIIVEKIDDIDNEPLVEFKLNKGGKVLKCQAILKIGKENNLLLKESKSAKKLRIIAEEEKLKTKLIIEEKKAIALKQKAIIEEERMRVESIANEVKEILNEKVRLDEARKLEESKQAIKLEQERLQKEKIDVEIKKIDEQLKKIKEEEKIKQDKIRLIEEAKQEKIRLIEEAKRLEEIKLLEQEKKLEEELIEKNRVENIFYNSEHSYKIDVDYKYKNIKITNQTTGVDKIFESKGAPRKVILNQNTLIYDNIIDESSHFNYTIDIESENVLSKKLIDSQDMGGSAYAKKLTANEGVGSIILSNTIINILFDNSGSMGSTLDPLETMAENNLKSALLPFYDNDESLYNSNVNVRRFTDASSPSNYTATNGIVSAENSIVLGGVDMVGASNNVINIMFQDEANGNALSVFEGEQGTGFFKGSVQFMKDGLDVKDNNTAIFFTVATGGVGQTVGGVALWRETVQDLKTSLNGTVYEDKTDFTFDIISSSSASYYTNLIVDALNRITS